MTPGTLAERPADPRQSLGRLGEHAAAERLREAGLQVIERRFRTRYGEIDLIARDGALVVFVEVKTRRSMRYGRPASAVTPRKQTRIARVANAYLQRRGWLERPCRFDVVEVFVNASVVGRVHHIADAFRLWPGG